MNEDEVTLRVAKVLYAATNPIIPWHMLEDNQRFRFINQAEDLEQRLEKDRLVIRDYDDLLESAMGEDV